MLPTVPRSRIALAAVLAALAAAVIARPARRPRPPRPGPATRARCAGRSPRPRPSSRSPPTAGPPACAPRPPAARRALAALPVGLSGGGLAGVDEPRPRTGRRRPAGGDRHREPRRPAHPPAPRPDPRAADPGAVPGGPDPRRRASTSPRRSSALLTPPAELLSLPVGHEPRDRPLLGRRAARRRATSTAGGLRVLGAGHPERPWTSGCAVTAARTISPLRAGPVEGDPARRRRTARRADRAAADRARRAAADRAPRPGRQAQRPPRRGDPLGRPPDPPRAARHARARRRDDARRGRSGETSVAPTA